MTDEQRALIARWVAAEAEAWTAMWQRAIAVVLHERAVNDADRLKAAVRGVTAPQSSNSSQNLYY